MTVIEIRARVDAIRKLTDDPEAAHVEEDKLRAEVLFAIAERRCMFPASAAHEVLKTDEISFPRWCA